MFTLLGYWLGGAYKKAEKYAGWASTGILIVVVVLAVGLFIRGRLAEKQLESTFATSVGDEESALAADIAKTRSALDDD